MAELNIMYLQFKEKIDNKGILTFSIDTETKEIFINNIIEDKTGKESSNNLFYLNLNQIDLLIAFLQNAKKYLKTL